MHSDWQPGSRLTSTSPPGEGTVVEAVGGQRLIYEWIQTDAPENNGGHPSTVTFALTPMGEVTRLSVGHGGLDPDAPFLKVVSAGWPMILSSLKSLLETGEPLAYALGT